MGYFAQRLRQFKHPCPDRLAIPKTNAVFEVHAVGRCVLTHNQQLLDAAFEQRARLRQYVADRARHQVAAHRRNDTKGAAVVAALADLEIGVVARRELDPGNAEGIRNQVDKGIMGLWQIRMHRIHHLLRRVRPGDGQHLGMHLAHQVGAVGTGFRTQASGNDDASIFGQCLANGVQTFPDCVVDEAASIDDHQIGARERLGSLVPLGAEPRQDQFGIGQRFRAPQADKSNPGRADSGLRGLCLQGVVHGGA